MTVHSRTPKYPDWKITFLFYAVLHMVDGYFERNGIELSENHRDRIKLVKKELPLLSDSYVKLYKMSTKARYVLGNRLQDVDRHGVSDCFIHIEKHIGLP